MAKQLDTLNKHLDKRDGSWFHEMAGTWRFQMDDNLR